MTHLILLPNRANLGLERSADITRYCLSKPNTLRLIRPTRLLQYPDSWDRGKAGNWHNSSNASHNILLAWASLQVAISSEEQSDTQVHSLYRRYYAAGHDPPRTNRALTSPNMSWDSGRKDAPMMWPIPGYYEDQQDYACACPGRTIRMECEILHPARNFSSRRFCS